MTRVLSWIVSSRSGRDFLISWCIELGRCAFQNFICRASRGSITRTRSYRTFENSNAPQKHL
jgi:hypothetical protein